MNADEFIKECLRSGYALKSDEDRILEWCDRNPKENYTAADFEEIYRLVNTPRYGENNGEKWRVMAGGVRTTKRCINAGDDKFDSGDRC